MKILKQMLAVLMVFFFLVPQVYGATYYCSIIETQMKTRVDAWPDADNGTDVTDIEDAIGEISNDDTLIISGGVSGVIYAGTDLDSGDGIDIAKTGITIRGAIAADTAGSSHSGQVTFDGTGIGDSVIRVSNNIVGNTFENLKLIGADDSFKNLDVGSGTTTLIVNDSEIAGAILSSGELTINRSKITGGNALENTIDMNSATANITLNYCQLYDNVKLIRALNGTMTFNHSVLHGFTSTVLFASGVDAPVVAFNNSVVTGNNIDDQTHVLRNTSAGTMTATNCILLPNADQGDSRNWEGLIDGGNNIYELTRFREYRRPCVITLTIDDQGNRKLWNAVAEYATTKGIPVTFALSFPDNVEETDAADALDTGWESLRARVAEGHEIASHSIDADDVGLKSQGDLEAALSQSKASIESGVGGGYSCDSFVYPGGHYGADASNQERVIDTVKAEGYLISRAISNTYANRFMADLTIYDVMGMPLDPTVGATNIKRNISGIVATALWNGGIWNLYAHGDGGVLGDASADTWTLQNWKDTIDALVDIGAAGYVMTLKDAAAYIIANGTDADSDGLRYTRTFPDAVSFKLSSQSPAIDAGLWGAFNQEGQEDPWGNYIFRLPNSGPDQGAGAPKGGQRNKGMGGAIQFN